MNTLAAWEKRLALRRAPEVRDVLHNGWWMTALRTLKAQDPDVEIPLLDKSSYTRIYKLLFRSLAREFGEAYDEEEVCIARCVTRAPRVWRCAAAGVH